MLDVAAPVPLQVASGEDKEGDAAAEEEEDEVETALDKNR